MVELSRRSFLGGLITLIGVSTFEPHASAIGNFPKIYGDGKHDDSNGLGALFRNEPVIFDKDMIGVDAHEGIIFHKGIFVIKNTVHVPQAAKIDIDACGQFKFIGTDLPDGWPFFICNGNGNIFSTAQGPFGAVFEVKPGRIGQLIINIVDDDNE